MQKPECCTDNSCTCLWRDHSNTFCIGETPEQIDIVDGEEHKNDHHFCIITTHRGWEKHKFNKYDMSLVAKAMFIGMSGCMDCFNLNWLEIPVSVDNKIIHFAEQ